MTATERAASRKFTLRDAQKAHTRQRILEAARTVFSREGYFATTVDQIVAEAGASRPTFYLHFRDKEQILRELMDGYMGRALPYMERFPGPQPSVQQLEAWLRDIGAFLEREQAIASVLTEVSAHRQSNRPRHGLAAIAAWIEALSHRAPAFAAAVNKISPDIEASARAQLLMIGVAWAGETIAMNGDQSFADAAVKMVARSMHEFLTDPRFHPEHSTNGRARTRRASGASAGRNARS